jgi:hypothetical protein
LILVASPDVVVVRQIGSVLLLIVVLVHSGHILFR